MAQGVAYQRAGQYANARAAYTRALALETPNSRMQAALYFNRSACQRQLGQLRLALSDAQKAAEIEHTMLEAIWRAAEVNRESPKRRPGITQLPQYFMRSRPPCPRHPVIPPRPIQTPSRDPSWSLVQILIQVAIVLGEHNAAHEAVSAGLEHSPRCQRLLELKLQLQRMD